MTLETQQQKLWANLDNPINLSYDLSNFWLISCVPPSEGHSATVCNVTTVQGTVQLSQKFTFHENTSSQSCNTYSIGMLGLR